MIAGVRVDLGVEDHWKATARPPDHPRPGARACTNLRHRRLVLAPRCGRSLAVMRQPENDVLRVAPEAAEILKHGLDQCLPAWILSGRGTRKHGQQIAHLVGGLLPI